jgi:predicted TIM-barrel enzyme
MRGGAGDALLGIASGITPENVKSYMPYANCFLVASGIGSSWSELDPARVRMLVQAVKS